MTRKLVFEEFSGAGYAEQIRFEDELKSRHAPAELVRRIVLSDEEVTAVVDLVRAATTALLVCVMDFNDDWTPECVWKLLQRCNAEELPGRRSCFAEFPVCTLLVYHRPNERYFLIRGLSAGQASPAPGTGR